MVISLLSKMSFLSMFLFCRGTVSLQSSLGKGTTVAFTVPTSYAANSIGGPRQETPRIDVDIHSRLSRIPLTKTVTSHTSFLTHAQTSHEIPKAISSFISVAESQPDDASTSAWIPEIKIGTYIRIHTSFLP